MTERRRVDILGCGVDLVDVGEALHRVTGFIRDGSSAQVVTFGAEMAVHAAHDAGYRELVNAADLVVADTVGIVWASRVLAPRQSVSPKLDSPELAPCVPTSPNLDSHESTSPKFDSRESASPLVERVAGIELVERLCDVVECPVYFLGAADGVAATAAAALQSRHPGVRVAGTQHGYFSASDMPSIAEAIRSSGARLVLVALGFPRQEFWIRDHLSSLGPVTCIGVGGAFDVWAGKTRRAPESWRRTGLEWLFRLVTEPRRLERQLALPEFALRVLAQRVFTRRLTM